MLSSHSVLSDRNALLASLVRHGICFQPKVDLGSYYTALKYQEKQQSPATAYATHASAHQKPRSLQRQEKSQVAVTGYAVSACATDARYIPVFKRSHMNSPVKVGSETPYTAQGNKEKEQATVVSGYAVSAYAAANAPDSRRHSSIKDDAPIHKRSHKNSPGEVGTETHYSAPVNQEKSQFAVSAYGIDCPVHKISNKSPQLKAGKESPSTSQVNQKKPQSGVSGYATHAPVHNGSNKSLQLKAGTQNHPVISGDAANAVRGQHKDRKPNQCSVDLKEIPQVVVSGVQVVTLAKQNQPSQVTPQRQGYANVPAQQVWRPRTSNK